MLYGIIAATSALLLAALLAALLRVPALRVGLVERRRGRALPVVGGFAAVVATVLVARAGEWFGVAPLGGGTGRLLVAGSVVGGLGLAADLWRVRGRVLVVGTAVAAAFVVPYGEVGVLGGVLAVAWIVFVSLAFRGLDHADGVVGTVGVLTAFGVGACAVGEVMDGLAALLSVLAAALTGALMHNWHPARVGIGSCGALFTGFVVSSAAVLTQAGREPGEAVGVLFALTAVASADLVLVALAGVFAVGPRARGRRSGAVASAGRGPVPHLAHRLRLLGLTSRGAVVVVGVGAFSGVLVGVLADLGFVGGTAVAWVAVGALVTVLGLSRVRVKPQLSGPLRVRNG
ncbi:glycosyl transferase family 4 [Actinobacteria bacterium OK074]|nr:glycosyl transferase family 4 [Actinobacteria bacterium OK074]